MPINNIPFTGSDGILFARLLVLIKNSHTGLYNKQFAVIDTGATYCGIPGYVAENIGHDVETGKSILVSTVNARSTGYLHSNILEICHPVSEEILYTTEDLPVLVMPNSSRILLGRLHFLNNFILTIDYPNQPFSLNYPTKKKGK